MIKALTLQFQPEFMDILPLYIVLLAVLPFVLAGFRLWPAGVLAASFGLWGAVQLNKRIALAAYPGPDKCGSSIPSAGRPSSSWAPGSAGVGSRRDSLAHQPLAVLAGGGWALAGFLIRFSWTLHWLYDPFPALSAKLWPLLSKTNLSPLRFANVLVLALLVARLIPAQAAFLAGRGAAVYHVRAAFTACLLPRYPARDDWASGDQRIPRRSLLQCAVSAAGIAS